MSNEPLNHNDILNGNITVDKGSDCYLTEYKPSIINLTNYKYIPLYIHRIIQICIISNIFTIDIYQHLANEVYQLYLINIKSYIPPMSLSMSYMYCKCCNKKIKHSIYSKLIDLHYGWNHCIDCYNVIDIWYSHYIEYNLILPFDYIDNFDIDTKIYYYRTRTNTIAHANINIFKKTILYNKTSKKIVVPIYWIENDQSYEKWISLTNILYHTNNLNQFKYRVPEYWSINTINLWDSIFTNTYHQLNQLNQLTKIDNKNKVLDYLM